MPLPLALCGGLLAAFSREGWSQALITEVYGLNLALFGIALDLLLRWSLEDDAPRRARQLTWLGLVLGLAASHHTSAVLWSVAALATVLAQRPRELLDARLLARGAGAFLLGLAPLLYLPWASARDPALDWGNPETWQGFVAVVTRSQYLTDPVRSLHDVLVQLAFFARLTAAQWPLALLGLLPAGLWWLARPPRRLWVPLLSLWLASGPVVALLANFPIATPLEVVNAETSALESVFFIPAHWLVAFVLALGLARVVESLSAAPARAVTALALLLPVAVAAWQWPRVDMSRQVFAQRYVDGLFTLAEPGALVLTTWDPYTFPTLYAQHVEGRRPDVVVIDQFLMSTSWYVRQQQRRVPALLGPVQRQADAFLEAIVPVEADLPDAHDFYPRYRALIEDLIDAAVAANREVILTFPPSAETLRRHPIEPLYWGYRVRATAGVTPVDPANLSVAEFLSPAVRQDRMALHVRDRLERVLIARAQWCEVHGPCPDREALADLVQRFAAARGPRELFPP